MTDDIEDYPVTQHHSSSVTQHHSSNFSNPTTDAIENDSFSSQFEYNDYPLIDDLHFNSIDHQPTLSDGLFQNYHLEKYNLECMKSMYALFLSGKLTDVVLKVGNESFRCHKVILAGASPYFRAMFTSGMKEASMQEIPIHCISSKAINGLLHFIYTGNITIGETNVCELLSAATMLQMQHVIEACCTFLEKQFHPSNVIGIFDFANTNGCRELSDKAQHFIDTNFSDVARFDEFLNLKPCQLIVIIRRDELNVRSESEIFNAVIRWTNQDRVSRVGYLYEILSHVRMHQMPPHFIRSQIKNCDFLRVNQPLIKGRLEGILDDLLRHKKVVSQPRTGGFNEVLYSAGGYYKYSLATFECYRPGEGGGGGSRWQRRCLASIPTARSGLAGCAVHGRLYVVGGRNNSEQCNVDTPRLDCYDPANAAWHACAPMSIPRHRVAVGVIDDLIYAVGGSASALLPSSSSSSVLAAPGSPGNSGHAPSTSTNSMLHHNSAERFDPDSGQWTPVAAMHHRRIGLGVATVNRLLYAVGGFDGENRLGSVERYNPDTDSWEFVASLNKTRSGAGVVAVDQHIYAIGGYDSSCQLSSVERYDTDTDRWELVAPMLRPRSALGAAVHHGKIWVFGGYDGNEFLTSVEMYDPSTNVWTEVAHMSAGKSGHAVFVGREPVSAEASETGTVLD